MKLLIVTPYYTPYIIGGAEISLQLLAEGLAKKKYDVTVLTLSYKYEERMCNGVRILSINNNSLFSVWDKTISHKPLTKDESHLLQFTPLMVMYKDYKLYTDIFKRNKFDLAIINSNEEWFGRPTLWKALKK
jgi:glycosyltransferase involved in cell wall biosynthesis